MKKKYISAELDLCLISTEDVMNASGETTLGYEQEGPGDFSNFPSLDLNP